MDNFIVSLYDKNDKFNELSKKLIEDVLSKKFFVPNPSNPDNIITLDNIDVKNDHKGISTYIDKKKTKGNLTMKVYADIVEKNQKGEVVKTISEKVLLGSVPYRSQFATYHIGNDYSIVNQMRNKPGIYTTLDSQGAAVSAFQFEKGRSFKLMLAPKSKKLTMKIGSYSAPAMPLLRIFGFDDRDMERVLGPFFRYNKQEDWDEFYQKMKTHFFSNDPSFVSLSADEKNKKIRAYFTDSVKLDPGVLSMLIGVSESYVTKEVLENVIIKLVGVFKREKPEDDRDDLIYNKILTPSHLFADRLNKQMPTMLYKATYQIRGGKSPENAFKNILTKPLQATALNSDLSRLDPQYNIMSGVVTGRTVTPIGEGAISGLSTVKTQTRQFHMSHAGLIDPTFTPQGMAVGVSLRAAPNLAVDMDGNIQYKLKNIRTGKEVILPIEKVRETYILQPGEPHEGMVKVLKGKDQMTVPFDKVQYEFADSVFTDSLQLVPLVGGMQGPRGIMAATQLPQAVALKKREAAYVIPKNPKTGKAADEVLGHDYLDKLELTAPFDATILSIEPEVIRIKSSGGQERTIRTTAIIPLQYNTGIKIFPNPKLNVGDSVKKGDPLFLTNHHDSNGTLALGKHLRVITGSDPRGYGVEDGLIISESAAKDLTSEHIYRVEVMVNPDDELSYPKVQTFFRHKYKPEKLTHLDQTSGLVKVGETLDYGDVIAAKVTRFEPNDTEAILGKLSRSFGTNFIDSSVIWDKFHHGTVKEVIPSGNNFLIVVETEEPAEVGTKLTGRFGNKGVVSLILPDNEMPRTTTDNKPVDIIYSAVSVPSRVNPNQVQEASLGKVAIKTGKRFVLDEFDTKRNNQKFTEDEMRKAGLATSGKEKVFNPYTGKTNDMFVGNEYILKLFSPEKSISARGTTGAYDTNRQPVKGGKEGSKALGLMELYALLGHNSEGLLQEFGTVKSEKNADFWRNFEMGLANMPKNVPFTFDKFSNMLTAAGAQVQRTPDALSLVPVTDKTTDELTGNRVITDAGTVKGPELKVIKDGLFDVKNTGGLEGSLWSRYELSDAIPHPLLSDILRIILRKTKDEWPKFIADTKGSEMKKLLDDVNLDETKQYLLERIKDKKEISGSTSALRFLENLSKMPDTKLSDFVIKKLLVLPPKFRPMVKMTDGTQTVSDLNYLYMDVINADKLLKQSKGIPVLEADAKKNLVNSVDAFMGLADPQSKALQDKGVKGILTYLTGKTSPKEGFFLNKMIKRQQVMTGRARIIPNPNAQMDEIGIPEHIAWNSYEPHLRKELRLQGIPADQVTKILEEKGPRARAVLDKVLRENYVLVNRAPTLHKFNIIAGKPYIVDGNFIALPNFAEGPLNADYDGDETTIHVPLTENGKQDAKRMMLSNNPFTGYAPENLVVSLDSEAVFGFASTSDTNPDKLKKWWKENIPSDVSLPELPLNKKKLKNVMVDIAKKHPSDISTLFHKLNTTGIKWSSEEGLTVGLDDIKPSSEMATMISEYKTKIKNAGSRDEQIRLADELQKKLQDLALNSNSFLSKLVRYGAKGKPAQIASILSSLGTMLNPRTGEIEFVDKNTSTGYDFSTFLNMNAKGRSEMIKTKLAIAEPGDLYKQIAYNTRQETVSMLDCDTERYIEVPGNDGDLLGRLLARPVNGLPRNAIVTSENITKISGESLVKVRSPLTCDAAAGVCARCYGADDYGKLPEVGERINIKAVNSFSEQLAQKALDAKHSGRSLAEDAGKTAFHAAKELFMGTIKDEAVVSSVSGTVDSVTVNDDNTKEVVVSGKKFSVPVDSNVIVKEGDSIDIGTILSDGDVNTKTIGNTMGHGHAASMFTQLLHDTIFEPQGMNVHRRNVELVARALYKYVEVKEPFGSYLPGDRVSLQEIAPDIERESVEKTLDNVRVGERIGKPYLTYQPMDIVSFKMIQDLKDAGIKSIKIFLSPEKVAPLAKGTSVLPLVDDKQWLDNMGYRFLKKNIQQALASGQKQTIDKSVNPLGAYVLNAWD